MRIKSVRGIDIAIIGAALASCLVVVGLWQWTWANAFWDFDVYRRAVADSVLGYDPYRHDVPFPFLYHPVVLYTLVLVDRFVGLEYAFIVLYGAALLTFLRGCKNFREDRSFQGQWLDTTLIVAAAFSFGGIGVLSVMTGNITFYLHLALIGSTLIYLDGRKNWQWLLVLVLFSFELLVKPYFILYALPLFLIEGITFRSAGLLSISILFAVWVYLLFWVFDRAHSLHFIEALRMQLGSRSDLGISFFSLAKSFLPVEQALKIYFAGVAVLALAVLFLRRLTGKIAVSNDTALFLLGYAAIALCNPRTKEYDLVPALLCLYLYFSLHGLLGRSMILLSLCIGQIPLWVAFCFGPETLHAFFAALGFWQTAGALVPALIFFAVSAFGAGSKQRAQAAAT